MTKQEIDKIMDDISKTISPKTLKQLKQVEDMFDKTAELRKRACADLITFGFVQPDTQTEIDKTICAK